MSKATNYAKATYQEVYDLSTVSGKLSIIGIHTPTGLQPRQMLSGFFEQFRKFRYRGCSLTMIPAAQLPADPLQVSWEAGQTIDPRDLLNPILFHGCHGEELNSILDSIYASSGFAHEGPSADDNQLDFGEGSTIVTDFDAETMYYAGLSDPSFRKFNVQTGVKLSNLHPLVHVLGTSMPVLWGASNGPALTPTQVTFANAYVPTPDGEGGLEANTTRTSNPLQTVRTQPLGWLPTTTFQNSESTLTLLTPVQTQMPKLFMGVLIMPPSYQQELYFRMVITHYFEFKDFSTSLNKPGFSPSDGDYNNWLPDSVAGTSIDAIDANVKLTTSGVF